MGDEFSHTYACAKSLFAGEELKGWETIRGALESLKRGCDFCVVPIENSVEGTVTECLDLLTQFGFFITSETIMPIHQALLAKTDDISKIKTVYSHPQALSQCRKFLADKLPCATQVASAFTSAAVRMIDDESKAAIARADIPGYIVLNQNIEDYSGNCTRFITVSLKPSFDTNMDNNDLQKSSVDKNNTLQKSSVDKNNTLQGSGANKNNTLQGSNASINNSLQSNKASIMFSAPDKAGALFRVLGVFDKLSINLTKIESRPNRARLGGYNFFTDFMVSGGKDALDKVIKLLEPHADNIKLLGFYRAAIV